MIFQQGDEALWRSAADAKLRDVVLLVCADEAHYRDINHGFASTIAGDSIVEGIQAPYPEHADDIRMAV